MEDNKRKALIKSVAAFTFAVSMFAAQSPTASAADVGAAGMLGNQILHSEDEENPESEAAETAGNDENGLDGTDSYASAKVDVSEVTADSSEAPTEVAVTDEASAEENTADSSEAAPETAVTDETAAEENTADNGEAALETAVTDEAAAEENTADNGETPTEAVVTDEAAAEENTADSVETLSEAEATDEAAVYAAESAHSILGGANGYNVFVEGNYTQTGNNNIDVGDGGGVVAVGGSVNVGEGVNHKGSSFEVGGSVTGTLQGNNVAVGEDCTVDFKTTFDELRATSSAISKADGTTVNNGGENSYIKSEYGTLTLKGSNEDVNIFNMTVEEFNAMKTSDSMAIKYDVPDNSTVIVNIVGEGDVNLVFDWGAFYNNDQLTSGNKKGNSKVMINVPNGNNVTIASGVGSLLAPSSSVTGGENKGYNPHYEGQVICKEFSGNIEFGSSSFDYTIIDAEPEEPSTPPAETDTPNTPGTPEEDNTTDDETETPDTPVEDDTPDEPETPDTPVEDDTPDDETETPDTPVEDNTPDDETDTPDTPVEDNTPDDETDTPDTPVEGNTPDETDTPDTPVEDNTPETPDTPSTPDTPDTPSVTHTPDTPNVPYTPNTPDIPDTPFTPDIPVIDFEMFDEPEVPHGETPFEEEQEDEPDSETPSDTFETFDDSPVPLADDPFGDTDSASVNPKMGVDMTVAKGAAAAAMASFMAIMIANRKKREENN